MKIVGCTVTQLMKKNRIKALALGVSIILGAIPLVVSGTPSFQEDIVFLQQHTDTVVLRDGAAAVVVVPDWQGRVMTSTFDVVTGPSCGWINRPVIAEGVVPPEKREGRLVDHIHVFGGEERLWFGPEGGQFSIFFPPGSPFEFEHWKTPAMMDTEPFPVTQQNETTVRFSYDAELTNWSGTRFQFTVHRKVAMLDVAAVESRWDLALDPAVEFVAYETDNRIRNSGPKAWTKKTGLMSIWILGMYPPSDGTTVVVPFHAGREAELGPIVTDDYFGKIPADRLRVEEGVIFFKGDGGSRGKLGLSPQRSKNLLGSYAEESGVLTLVSCLPAPSHAGYVNSAWELQDDPFEGDAINAYNDGAPTPGAAPLGPFYELETSSPAGALSPNEELRHVQMTVHLRGPRVALDRLATQLLGVGLDRIEGAFE